jgi:LPS-assembly protein
MLAAALLPTPAAHAANQKAPQQPASGGSFTLEADHQRQVGGIFYADGNVDLHYQNARLQADHMEYHDDTHLATAHGHVQLDYLTQHVEAEDGTYNIQTGEGTFHHVRATFAMQRRPQPTLLISQNPLYVEAEEVDRLSVDRYKFRKAWITMCRPDRPTWKFYAPEGTVQLERTVHLENGRFRLFSLPVLYLPYATLPASRQRQSGFLIPDAGNSSTKGYFVGESYYWAPADWMDGTIGANYLSKRGWSQTADFRMRPWENVRLNATYFGVLDRGLPEPNGTLLKEGGHEAHLDFDALLPDGWRAVADLDQLTSLTFRLAWADTFSQAVNSEVRNTAFLTKNFSGFSLNFEAGSYKDFVSVSPESYVDLRSAPEAHFSSVDQAPFEHIPLYFSFDSFVDGIHRNDNVTNFNTGALVGRMEVAPSMTMPLHWGPWLDVTSSFTLRAVRYGAQIENGVSVNNPFVRTTEEATIDVRPPTLDRVWGDGDTRWKHAIEPEITYRYVNGVDDFQRVILMDDYDTITDTSELQYGITQRLFRKTDGGEAQDLVDWSVTQKYFFDPTFGGALVPGVRNVFETLDLLTPFAFADEPRHFSPIVSSLTVTPGGRYDAQLRVDYDPVLGKMTAIGTLLKIRPYRETYLTLADFSVNNLPLALPPPNFTFQHRSDQVRVLGGYGDVNRPGWDASVGVSYDIAQKVFQDQLIQLGYNGSCCGIGLEYQRFSLGTVRVENRYSIVFRIANLGSAGNLRRQEKIF